MNSDSELYIVNKKVLPEIFSKVIEAKKLLNNGKAKTILDAVNMVGISRSAFYKYKDYVYEFRENSRGKTITIAADLDDTPGLLSNMLNAIADEGANILTINQTIPINGIANVTVTVETVMMKNEFAMLIQKLQKVSGLQTLKIIARE